MLRSIVTIALVATLSLSGVQAQDPAEGWMAYAVGTVPDNVERITRMEATWKVSESAKPSRAFYSPWFGMDPEDNLNLIQPVNPWLGSSWAMYTEYFQWSPEHNSNSNQQPVNSGQTLHGYLIYDEASDSYNLTQAVVETGAVSTQIVKCQKEGGFFGKGKKYKLPYIVYEKVFPCANYPTDGVVTFEDIVIECDGKDCTNQTKWTPMVKDSNCNFKANIISPSQISITWDTSAASKYDNHTDAELYDLNYKGWATKLNIKRPAEKREE
jgi:hypothetical protein